MTSATTPDATGGDTTTVHDEAVIDLVGDDVVIDLRDGAARSRHVLADARAGAFTEDRSAAAAPAPPTRSPRRLPPAVSLGLLLVASVALFVIGAIPAALVVIGVLSSVAAHEAGHLFAARAVGVGAREYFVGFGPRLWSTHRNEVEYGVKAIPLGGYVKLVDEDDAAPWRKAVIAIAGPAVNLLLALLLLIGVALAGTLPTTTGTTGDVGAVERTTIAVDRFWDATTASVEPIVRLPSIIVSMGGAAVKGDDVPADSERLVSPVGIGRLADDASSAGWPAAVILIAVINLALGLFNLVPLPPLDGGRIAAAGMESIASRLRRRRVVLTGKGFERIGLVVVSILLVAGAAALVLDVLHPLADPFAGG
ncbi:MAG TPA: site-2 protease family protein [Acidimicrobiales bacterium]